MDIKTSEIIQRIKSRRESLKLSYQELANRTGMSKSTLQRYETGDIANIPLSKIEVLANALETTPQYIMGWESRDIKTMDNEANLGTDEEFVIFGNKKLSPKNRKKLLDMAKIMFEEEFD